MQALMASMGYPEILLALICFLILCRLTNKNNGLPRSWPLIGMLLELFLDIHNIHDRLTDVLERSGCTFLFKGPWFCHMDMLNTVDPANIHYIMSTNFSNFPKGSTFMKLFDVLGDGIFNTDSVLWRNQRKVARALMSHRRFFKFLVKTSKDKVEKGLIPVLEHGSKQGLVMDLQDLFQRFTFDATCILVTGYDPRSLSIELPEVPFSKAINDAEKAIFFRHVMPESLWKLQRWMGIGEEKKLRKAWEILDHTIAKYISMKREELSEKGKKLKEEDDDDDEVGVDLLTSYMNEDESRMGILDSKIDKLLRDTILNFMIAGRDTTSSALTWFFWLVSKNPLVETKIREELKTNIPKKEGEKWRVFNLEELSKMVYLHGALCETLRLYPPVPFQHKTPLRPDILPSGHKVNPKMKILFPLYAMGRMKSIWGKNCLEFKPERWISDRGGIKHVPSYKFMAFNAGPRTCLGKEVAFTQMKAVAATIIHNYIVQVVDGHPVTPNASIILHMKYGLKVRFMKRWVE